MAAAAREPPPGSAERPAGPQLGRRRVGRPAVGTMARRPAPAPAAALSPAAPPAAGGRAGVAAAAALIAGGAI